MKLRVDDRPPMTQQLADLRDQEERLRLALNGGDLGMWDVDPRSGEAIWSDRHAGMQGYRPSDQPRSLDQWQRLVPPDDRERLTAAIHRARDDGSLFAEEHRLHLDQALSVPLCVGPGGHRPTATISLQPGAQLVAYTDGLVERRTEPITDSIERVVQRVTRLADRPVADIADDLVASVTADGDVAGDDVVIACFTFVPHAD